MKIPKPAIPKRLLNLFEKEGEIHEYITGKILFSQGELVNKAILLDEGLLRYFHLTSDGKEVTRVFLKGPDLPLAFNFITREEQSFYTAECLRPSRVSTIPWDKLASLIKEDLDVSLFYIKKLEEIYFYREFALQEQQTKQAPENYKNFLEEFGDDVQHISNRIIASYLNISPETLSRLKKNIK